VDAPGWALVSKNGAYNKLTHAGHAAQGAGETELYNFLVTAKDDAWSLPAYEYERNRFGEYTAPALKERFKSLTAENIEELKSYPAMFAYEGEERDVRIGYLRRIKERARSILIEYDFEPDIPAIPFAKIAPLKGRLDIDGSWEMHRTHWALKDEDLFEILHSARLIGDTLSNSAGRIGRVEEMRFKVALSFPGEKRDYVNKVANELKKRLPRGSVFYDRDFTAQLARPNLDTLLQRVYSNNSDLVVVFLSSEYETKEWCGLEWRAIREIIKNKSDDSLMLMRFDSAAIPGSFSLDGYIDLNEYDPVQAARFILERVALGEP
jgi:TIR domain